MRLLVNQDVPAAGGKPAAGCRNIIGKSSLREQNGISDGFLHRKTMAQ